MVCGRGWWGEASGDRPAECPAGCLVISTSTSQLIVIQGKYCPCYYIWVEVICIQFGIFCIHSIIFIDIHTLALLCMFVCIRTYVIIWRLLRLRLLFTSVFVFTKSEIETWKFSRSILLLLAVLFLMANMNKTDSHDIEFLQVIFLFHNATK